MSRNDRGVRGVQKDAEIVEERFGPAAEVYAEARREAAAMAGDRADKKHWDKVVAEVEDEVGER